MPRRNNMCAYCGGTKSLTNGPIVPRCLFIAPYPKKYGDVLACKGLQ